MINVAVVTNVAKPVRDHNKCTPIDTAMIT